MNLKRILRGIRSLYFPISLAKNYSFNYAICNWLSNMMILNKIGLGFVYNHFIIKRNNYIREYIDVNFKDVVGKYKSKEDKCELAERIIIWVFWAQDIDNAPDIVKICNKQLKDNNEGCVVNLDMCNYSDYITLPNHVIDKVNSKKMGIAHFSDILRLSLLSKYGGLWVDATCWINGSLNNIIKPKSICTLASQTYKLPGIISDGRWTTYFIGTDCIDNTLISLCRDIHYKFWEYNDVIIDYLFFDSIIEYIYINFDDQKKMVDNGAIDATYRWDLQKKLNSAYNEMEFKELMTQSKVFKLSYKYSLYEFNYKGNLTAYGHLKKIYL